MWKRERCPAEDGIYFPDDTWVPLNGLAPQGQRGPIPDFSNFLTDVYHQAPLARSAEYVAAGGMTSWEGSGYLALLGRDGHDLLWILHSSESEPFVAAALSQGCIKAFSSEYPFYCEWLIPVSMPWGFSCRQQFET